MMWFLLLLCVIHIEPVILQGNSDRLILKGGTTPCEGHIEIYHEGKWGFVGDTHWNRSTEEVVCNSAHCGTPEDSWYVSRPLESKVWLDNLECNGGESQLWQCEHPGWNTAFYPQDMTRMVKCSNKVNISLDGFDCAGAVKYTTDGDSGYFCSKTWEKSAADFLCEDRGCGKSKNAEMKGWANWKAFRESTKMKTKCSDIEKLEHLWQCVTEEDKTCDSPAFVMCEGYERLQLRGNTSNVCHGQLEKEENGNWNPVKHAELQITPDVWCQQMFCGNTGTYTLDKNGDTQVECADNVSVTLKNSITKCYGEVHIKVNNNKDYPVCGSSWTKKEAEVVCRELSCGKMVSFGTSNRRVEGIMDNVECSGKESSVWHCKAKRDIKSLPLQCSSTATVVCGESLDVRLVDGPSECAGRVEIQYEGKWQKVDSNGWTETNSKTVCTQLDCGGFRESANGKFCQGSSKFLDKAVVKCEESSSNISECITSENRQPGVESKAVGIICNDHEVVFLEGNKSCSGLVGIEHGNNIYWLSGSKQTWNQETADKVCQQTHCGKSKEFSSTMEKMGDIWNETYSCSPNTKSLFKCEKDMTLPVSKGVTSANTVTRPEELCTEPYNTSANTTTPSGCEKKLTQPVSEGVARVECTGKIKVTLTKGCWGHVNICEGEECGGVCADAWTDKMSETLCENLKCGKTMQSNRQPNPQSKVIFKSVHIPKHAINLNQSNLVRNNDTACKQAYVVCSESVKLELNSRCKCSGNVEMIYEDQAVPVCKKALENSETKKVICKTLKCGDFLEEVSYFGPESASASVISNIECSPDSKSLDECTVASDRSGCELGGLRCSNWSKTELKFDKACSGAVFTHSSGGITDVKNEILTTNGDKFCEELNCGKFKSYKNSTIRYSQEQLRFIECEGEPKVTLSEKCGGEVKINDINVCSTNWDDKYSDLICKEQGCDKAIATITKEKDKKNMEYYHVTCEDYHHKLGQCSKFKAQCKDKLVSVYCVSRVQFKTTDTCGGWININYQNKWEKLCPPKNPDPSLEEETSRKLCEQLGCGKPNKKLKPKDYMLGKRAKSVMTLDCPGSDSRIKYCIKNSSCDERPAEIYCEGFEPPPSLPPPPPTPVLAIILGVGISLILVILIAVYVRFYIVRRAKKPINFPSRMVPNKEIEFESGEYDDVTRDEIEDYSPGRFRSEARVNAESDMRSASPISYDDIDEKAETQPLTFQGAPAGTLRDNFINEGAIRQSSDDVNYEVEDPPENYDDIDASPLVSQTKAEVHGSSQTTTEGIPVATPGSVPEDKGYLVPGQDG